jgi:3-oxoacyl-[acyl-carrier protein] reductase
MTSSIMDKKVIVIAGTRGIGKAIVDELNNEKASVTATSSLDLDTSNITQVKDFIAKQDSVDVLVMNTSGPPSKDFFKINENEWDKYYRQLFLSFVLMLQKIKINRGGYIFLISSSIIKEPITSLILSNSYRIALTSVFKTYSKLVAGEEISCINIAPGPIRTDRLVSLVEDIDEFEKTLPMGRAGDPSEIGRFVAGIIKNDIKYLSGVTINFDGALSNTLL